MRGVHFTEKLCGWWLVGKTPPQYEGGVRRMFKLGRLCHG